MKKRFLPISLLLTIIILAQTSFAVNANGDSGEYIPRTSTQSTAQSFMKSIRANQETGLIDPAWLVATENSLSRAEGDMEWISLGPDNYGSLTRGIIYDKNDATNKTIYIGTMGGGVFQSVNGGITWKTISKNMMVNCMAQAEDGTVYIGTGDGRSAHQHNGLEELNYETSFVGGGIYTLGNDEPMEGTSDWKFINDIATYKNDVYAATERGLYRYSNNDWTPIFDTVVYGVEVCPNGTVLAVVANNVYMIKGNGEPELLTNGEENKLPTGDTYKIIAVSPSDNNFMYVTYLSKYNGTGNIYVTSDAGETWQIAYTATSLYDIFGERGLIDNAMTVHPDNPRKVLIGGLNLWIMRDELGEGIYRLECISDGNGFQISQSGGAFYYNYKYIHSGIQKITFNPSNSNEFFIGSEGGVFKGSYSSNGYLYEGANRYFETADNHTSVVRMFSVGFSNEENLTIGGSLDHGTINVYGDPNTNNVTEGSAIFPNDIATTDAAATYGAFDFTKAGGPCAMSSINNDIMFITTTGSYSIGTPVFRTQSAGDDYDKENFTYSATDNSASIKNTKAFRTPIALFENFEDYKSIDSVTYYAKRDFLAGETITDVQSHNCEYPFDYKLTRNLNAGDSIRIQDIISSTFLIAIEGKVYMTRSALKFNEKINWWLISTISGIPNALTLSADGNVAYVGTLKGKLYKLEGLSDAVIKDLAVVDSVKVITSTDLTATEDIFGGRAITSIAIDPKDSNKVIVTLGNYGNDDYVFYSTDGATFTSVQNNLPKVPVYSSLIEKSEGLVILGTENGIYTSDNMTTWTPDANISNVPVMDIKQQLQKNRPERYTYLIDEVGDTTTNVYQGIENSGIIYIATYGRGLYKCNKYKSNDGESIQENASSTAKSLEMSIYPNPVVNEATINFSIEKTSTVSYQIYDLSGRMIQNTILGNYGQGSHEVNFNVNGLSNGTYIIKVQAGTVSNTSKILVY